MKRKTNIFLGVGILIAIAISTSLTSCTQEVYDEPVKLTEEMLDATFEVNAISANNFQITTNSNENVISNQWDLGDGLGYTSGKDAFELFLPDAGVYEIKHRVTGAGGIYSNEELVSVNVETSDPTAGNLVTGGKFENTDDYAEWTIGGTGSTDGTWTFADGKATLTCPAWAGRGIYQAIEVQEGRSYQINMFVSSTSGCSDTWFEVYCGYSDPATVSGDYSEGGSLLNINTWSGSGTAPFAGKFTNVGTPTDSNGVFTATATGTVYLVIRGGGGDMKDGISITNVEFRGISE